ncbi:MAG: response regulator transcription factor [Elusimicrobia bacterium]|nr:response regulator transcription factor [Elusimicrobiota bacterium]
MGRGKILIVDDEKDMIGLMRQNFRREGYHPIFAADGESGLVLARKERPDLVIIDIMLPKMDGLEFCRQLRQEIPTPTLFLTGKSSEVDRILGLKMGGDDYVVKPFSMRELLARVDAILRRARPDLAGEKNGSIALGALEVDFERHTVQVAEKPVLLTPKEFEFLKLLIEAKGKVLSRDYLLERVWGYEKSMDIDTRTVDQHIAHLRRKLRDEGKRIVTVTNFGYEIKMDDARYPVPAASARA